VNSSTTNALLRASISALIFCAGSFTAAAAPKISNAPAVPHSVQVTLPSGTTAFPAGPGADLANQHCVICHSTGMVLRQPPLSFEEWKAEVAKMRAVYGAPLPGEDIEAIARYLTSINGKP
jgi:mono/diheme cytochrome c family protein